MRSRTIRRLLFCALATIVAATLLAVFASLAPGNRSAPDFSLMDSSRIPFKLSAHRGHTIVLVFGYTHCPDVCPTTLASLVHAKRELGAQGSDLQVAFITVDPTRDTPAVMTRYMRMFDPSFFGLSGTPAQLAAVYAAYHVYHQRLPSAGGTAGYDVAHSTNITLIGRDGRIRAPGDWDDSATALAAKIRNTVT